ncbi:chemotaxis protein CheW [Candidatus Falkowbacteria bacterium]|nr:chemotaxis protein CheW [Candidatus Falkowbacteria bacterium]
MANNIEKYKNLFIIEAEEKIAALNVALLGLEKKPSDSAFANDAMRAAHTLKSSAAAMGFMNFSHLCHTMEDFFSAKGGSASGGEKVRSAKQTLAPQNIEMLFQGVDTLSASIDAIKKGQAELSTAELVKKLGYSKDDLKPNDIAPNASPASRMLAPIETIRVNVKTLGTLMNFAEELSVTQMRFKEILRRTEERQEKPDIGELKVIAESFDRLTSDLQYNVTEAHMVPLGQLFEQTPRMVRDLAKEQGKEVEFSVTGQDIALDRIVVDRLGEPLIHLLRNAVDHGIEKKGGIILSAERLRNNVTVTVHNTGKPIDWERVVEVAAQKGIVDQKTRDAHIRDANLLYQLSTKKAVTETSGRGVGLGIVKSVIESLGGKVTIESKEDGTSFILALPLTIAIVQALLSRVANQVFALPFSQVDRLVRVPFADIKKAIDQEMAVVEGEDIPMIRLDQRFSIEREGGNIFLSDEEIKEAKYQLKAELMIITRPIRNDISNGAKQDLPAGKAGGASPVGLPAGLSAEALAKAGASAKVGIVVDEVLSEQNIVVKPLKGILRKTKGFAGVTLLGDGRPALILDIATLI